MKYTKECFWSRLEITVFWEENLDSVMAESFSLLDDFEQNYSRFISENILSEINKDKSAKLPKEIQSLISLCLKVSELTDGYFDITILPLLENAWYGISEYELQESLGYKNIILDWDNLTLKNNVNIEFGSCGKWYAVDLVYNKLSKYTDNFIVNFGWDMRVSWKKTIHLEDPMDTKKTIWTIEIVDGAIASSAGNKRRIWAWHHLINPKQKSSENNILSVYVTHRLWVFADVFSTALFVSPLEISKEVIKKVSWLEAMIILSDGTIYKSRWFDCQLTI